MNRGGRKKKKKERKKEKKEEDIQSDCCQLEKKRFFRSGKQFNRFLSRTISFPTNSFPTNEQKKKKEKKYTMWRIESLHTVILNAMSL